MNDKPYTTQLRQVSLPMADYLLGFRDAPRVQGYCAQCGNFGKHWGCPPYTRDLDDELRRYNRAELLCLKITFEERMSLNEAFRLLTAERLNLEERVRAMEQGGGRAFGLAGMCPYCIEGCTRPSGKPCRHPDLVRSSLEAYGFDVVRTAEGLFDLPILWSSDGMTPEYLVFVVGYFE